MKKVATSAYRPLGPFKPAGIAGQVITAVAAQARLELCALAPDLFRLRLTTKPGFSVHRSGAVCRNNWPGFPTQVRGTKTWGAVRTAAGELRVSWADAGWTLRDARGRTVLSGVGPESGHGRQGWRLSLALGESDALFGLGETSGTFNKRGLVREFWNSDVLAHAPAIHPALRALYLSIPFGLVLRKGQAAGLFWDNSFRQTWDVGQTRQDRWQLQAAGGEVDLYLFLGPEVSNVVSRFTELTGRMPLPPRWALGYHQCRYSYESRARVEEVARQFRRRRIPCDALHLDIDHMDGYRVFTFGKAFPKPAQLIKNLGAKGFKVVTIVDPGVKNDPRFGVLKRGRTLGAFVGAPGGKKDFVGKVWPGLSRWPDFLNARVRTWWGREQSALQKLGVAGFWNDMNEPAVFEAPGATMPGQCQHQSDAGPVFHAEAHNVYGSHMARASREGALACAPVQRPFVITRAGYAGVQRHAVVWTGDNSSTWEHLADAVQMCLNLGVSGLAFCGSDVGGFLDNVTPELLVRWTQLAAFTPLFRNHSNKGTIDQEPWALGPKVERICRRYLELRYQLLPYLYCLLAEAHKTGTPIMRPMFWRYARDPVAAALGDQFLLGRDLLVAPVLRQGAVARSVYLPRGTWIDFWTGLPHQGNRHITAAAPLDSIPLFARAGGILPLGPVRQYVGEHEPGTIDLHVWPGVAGQLDWYEDDGRSNSYLVGDCSERRITLTPHRKLGGLTWGPVKGPFRSEVKTWRVILHGVTRPATAWLDGRRLSTRFNRRAGSLVLNVANTPEPMSLRFG